MTPEQLEKGLASGLYRHDSDGELERRCSCCGDYWPADAEFFFRNPQRSADGLHVWCKACHQEARAPKPDTLTRTTPAHAPA